MKVNCLSCGHKVDLDEVYDTYEGQVKCFACGAILAIKTDDGRLKAVGFVKTAPPPSAQAAVHASR
jgi:ribosomal protein S27E